MKYFYSFFVLLCSTFLQSSAQDFLWMKQIGGTGNEYITDKTFDGNQKLVYVGNTQGLVDLNPGPNVFMVSGSLNSSRSFVSKADTGGNIIWIDTFGGTGYIHSEALTVDGGNAIYVTGFFRGTVDFDPGAGQQLRTSTSNIGSIFFMKLNTNGVLQWVNVLEGTAQNVNQGYDIIVSKENGIFVSGTFGTGNIDFDPGPGVYLLSAPVRHIFVAKYELDGSLIWAKSYGGDGPEESCVMETDIEGNIYLTGQFSSNCDFDPGPAAVIPYPGSQEKLYVLKWDKNGNYKWVRCFVGTGGSSYSEDIDYDNHGNLYVCGSFSGTMNFNDGGDGGMMTSSPYSSSYVVKLDTAGTYAWSFSIDYGAARSGYIDRFQNYYISGYYHAQNVDFDPGSNVFTMPLTGNVQSYIGKYNANGQFIWAKALQSSTLSRGNTVALDSVGHIYMTGEFNQTVDFNPGAGIYNATSNGADDIYLLKLFQCFLDPGVTVLNQSLTAHATGVTYQWIDCGTGQAIPGASNASFTPSQTGDYAVAISNNNGCKDTSDCYHITITPNSTNDLMLSGQVQVYPNPGSGVYNLGLAEGYTPAEIRVYNILGKEVLSLHTTERNTSIVLDAPAGLYFMQIKLKNGQILDRKIVHKTH